MAQNQTSLKLKRHDRLAAELITAIRKGVLKSGEKLPSIRTLASQYSISTVTVNKALQLVSEAGFITCKPQCGNFVNSITNFYENSSNKSLNSNQKTIHFLLPFSVFNIFTGSFYPQMVRALQEKVHSNNLRFKFDDLDQIDNLSSIVNDSNCYGVIYMPNYKNPYDLIWPEMDIPKVLLSLGEKSFDSNYITIHNYQAGQVAAKSIAENNQNIIILIQSNLLHNTMNKLLYGRRVEAMIDYYKEKSLSIQIIDSDIPDLAISELKKQLQYPKKSRSHIVLPGLFHYEDLYNLFWDNDIKIDLTNEFDITLFQSFSSYDIPNCNILRFSIETMAYEVVSLLKRCHENPQISPISIKIPMILTKKDKK